MNSRLYTPKLMDVAREGSGLRDERFNGLHAEATAVLGTADIALASIRARYREALRDELAQWQAQRGPTDADGTLDEYEAFLRRVDLAQQAVENVRRFVDQGDGHVPAGGSAAGGPGEAAVLAVQAQEAERSRLAQEIHDGPAQALTNAIFQVEYIERVLDHDPTLARTELRYLRQVLRRELGDIRSFISQLRPRILDQLGLEGSIREMADNLAALMGIPIATDLEAPGNALSEPEQIVVLRFVQEALQNIRKHAAATSAGVSSRVDGATWLLEVRDDGRGFDVGAVAARGRRNFGLQFMRERAELIGADFAVRSRPGGGTVVVLAIPLREEHT